MNIDTDAVIAAAQSRLAPMTDAECRTMLAEIIAALWCAVSEHDLPLVNLTGREFTATAASIVGPLCESPTAAELLEALPPCEPDGSPVVRIHPKSQIMQALSLAGINYAGARAVIDGISRGADPDLIIGELLNVLFGNISKVLKAARNTGGEWLAALASTSAQRVPA